MKQKSLGFGFFLLSMLAVAQAPANLHETAPASNPSVHRAVKASQEMTGAPVSSEKNVPQAVAENKKAIQTATAPLGPDFSLCSLYNVYCPMTAKTSAPQNGKDQDC